MSGSAKLKVYTWGGFQQRPDLPERERYRRSQGRYLAVGTSKTQIENKFGVTLPRDDTQINNISPSVQLILEEAFAEIDALWWAESEYTNPSRKVEWIKLVPSKERWARWSIPTQS